MTIERRLAINSTAFETRAALLEDGVVAELFVERTRSRGIAGNIYKGRVRKILPGMQCAFVDIGLDRDAFLFVGDVAEPSETDGELAVVGANDDSADSAPLNPRPHAFPPIESMLREGEDLLVQVAKEPIASKGARVTTHVTLPGRCLVYMPTVRHLGVSRRIDDEAERTRLKAVMDGLRERAAEGFIVRTAALGQQLPSLAADIAVLRARWTALLARAADSTAPTLVHNEAGLVDKLLRDLANSELSAIVVDCQRDYARVAEFLDAQEPRLPTGLSLHAGPRQMFEEQGIETEIEKALRSKVWLKSGGYIVINQTEALVAIDVNTGRYVGKVTLEDTVLKINLEAVKEIVRQIRLRDLGGIIVLDLIDMESRDNQALVLAALETEIRRDRSKSKVLQISDFGLVEMTRKRVKGSLERLMTSPCRPCGGSGRVKSLETLCYELHRELVAMRSGPCPSEIVVLVHPDLKAVLEGSERSVISEVERELGSVIRLRGEPGFAVDHFELAVP